MRMQDLATSFRKKHPEIDFWELISFMACDPTKSISFDEDRFPIFHSGKYSVWIGNQYVDGKIKVGDVPELHSALLIYDKHKSHLKPIKEVKDLDELIGLVKDLSNDFKPTRCISKGEQDLEKVYEDDEWIVYIPHTFEASRKIGGDTRWCTAASNGQERFDYYTKQGPLYVNVRKSDGEKFQFHFETHQFMDKEDKRKKIKELGLNEQIAKFYNQVYKKFNFLMTYYSFYDVNNQYAIIEKAKNKYNVINMDTLNCMFDDDMDYIYNYPKFYILRKSGKFMLSNLDGAFIFNGWFDELKGMNRKHLLFKKGEKFFLIDKDANMTNPEGFDNVLPMYIDGEEIMRGICVKQENKWQVLIYQTNDIWHSDDIFDDVLSMFNGKVIKLIKNNRAKFIFNKPGIDYCDEWFDISHKSNIFDWIYAKYEGKYFRIHLSGKIEAIPARIK